MRCPSCGFDNPGEMKFCGECAAPLQHRCAQCGFENPPRFKFCGECGALLTTTQKGKRAKGQKAKRKTRVTSAELSVASPQPLDARPQTLASRLPAGERRQLTVMFCDLVGSTTLSAQLDPEDYGEVVQAYQATAAEVVTRFEGSIAQHLGDGLLVYFGYPVAHEEDAARAVHAGLEILRAIHALRIPNMQLQKPLQVRIGIHTGVVVIGEIGGRGKHEQLALGETPNLAARLQGIAEPDTVVISAESFRLIQGLFTCRALGPQALKGIAAPVAVYHVLGESGAHSRFEVAVRTGLTPLIGREEEVRLLFSRWEQAKAGAGQVVVLSGEAGIGKSRLVQVLKEQLAVEVATQFECRCSPYYQNTAFYPVIELLQRTMHFHRDNSPEERLSKLEVTFGETCGRASLPEGVPLLARLLSLPMPDHFLPLTMTPQRQKQKTLATLLAWLLQEAAQQPVCFEVEDLHWADPSTLEFLGLLSAQAPTARLLLVLTARPEFRPPWELRSHMLHLMLNRLDRKHVETMVVRVAGGKALPAEVFRQVVVKTDGVPLFVEELTKMVVEAMSGQVTGDGGQEGKIIGAQHTAPVPALSIPTTLHDALMARLDRLHTAKEIAQVGATLGREFSYALLHAVSPLEEAALQNGLAQLVAAELLYQRGLPPQARYVFKHALVQDAAYQSLLKSSRQQYHKQIAQVLEEQLAETRETQPELLAHHYTEAGLIAQAIPYWQRAGQRAVERSANVEAISHLAKGLELLKTLPDSPERAQQELALQISLAVPLASTKGWAVPEVEGAYARGRELCQQVGEMPELFSVLFGLRTFYHIRGELQTARELAEQLLRLAQQGQAPDLLLEAHSALGTTLCFVGELASTRTHLEQGITLYNPQQYRSHIYLYSMDPGVVLLGFVAWTLWFLGYPDQAQKRSEEVFTLAQELAHPYSLAWALIYVAWFHQYRREGQAAQARAEAAITLATEQEFAQISAWGAISRGWALAEQGKGEEGIKQMREGQAALRAIGAELMQSWILALLAEAYEKVGRAEEGLTLLAEALAVAHHNGEHLYEAELYRLKGELTLQQASQEQGVWSAEQKSENPNPHSQILDPQGEAEACFLKAIDIAQRQQAKSLELRATVSLTRLWQQQGKRAEAHQMLSTIYNWFTEGFDTKDLREAKGLLAQLS